MLKLVYIINELANSNSNINIVVAARELLILIKSLPQIVVLIVIYISS